MSVAIVCMVNKTAIQTNSSKQQSQQSDIGCGLVSATSNTSETFTFDVCIWWLTFVSIDNIHVLFKVWGGDGRAHKYFPFLSCEISPIT